MGNYYSSKKKQIPFALFFAADYENTHNVNHCKKIYRLLEWYLLPDTYPNLDT